MCPVCTYVLHGRQSCTASSQKLFTKDFGKKTFTVRSMLTSRLQVCLQCCPCETGCHCASANLSGKERSRSVSCSSPTAGGTSSLLSTSLAVGRLAGLRAMRHWINCATCNRCMGGDCRHLCVSRSMEFDIPARLACRHTQTQQVTDKTGMLIMKCSGLTSLRGPATMSLLAQ